MSLNNAYTHGKLGVSNSAKQHMLITAESMQTYDLYKICYGTVLRLNYT